MSPTPGTGVPTSAERGALSAPRLSVLGMGFELPPAFAVREYVASLGGDTSWYKSWDNCCQARDENDQPSTLGAAAFKKALAHSGVAPGDIRLVLFVGVSRDYPASWSVAAEVMKLNGISGENALPLDITIGCVATLSALDIAQGWLALRGGGHAAIVAAERWSYTVDRSDPNVSGMWTWADGGAAMIVGMNSDKASIVDFLGAEFTAATEFNGQVIIPYGGTRNPVAPPGVNPYTRKLGDRVRGEMKNNYADGYKRAYDNVSRRFGGMRATRMVCNQMSPGTQKMIAGVFGIPMERVVVTGHETGHLGSGDAIFGLNRLHERNEIDGPIVVGSSTAYAFGAALMVPPGWELG